MTTTIRNSEDAERTIQMVAEVLVNAAEQRVATGTGESADRQDGDSQSG